ncbi:TniB family NTP-binding protein [Azospirillum sp. sgz301742]
MSVDDFEPFTPDQQAQLARIHNIFVQTTRTRRGLFWIAQLQKMGMNDHEAHCRFLLGPTGAGKSRVTKQFVNARPKVVGEYGVVEVPALLVKMPANCTLRSVAQATLVQLGDMDPTTGTEAILTLRVLKQIKRQNVKMLIFDEVQHMISARDDTLAFEVADWIKALLNENVCPILLVGSAAAERIANANEQILRRNLGFYYLEAFDWRKEDEQKEFRAILHLIDQHLGFPTLSGLGNAATALRIHHYCRGLMGHAMNLIYAACQDALLDCRPCVTYEHFARAVDELTSKSRRGFNPFLVEDLDPVAPASLYDDTETKAADEANRRARMRRTNDA